MANIRQAFEYAAKNPNSDFAKNLEQQASSGALDVEAKKYGLDLTPFKPTTTPVEQQSRSQLTSEQKMQRDTKNASDFLGMTPLAQGIGQSIAQPKIAKELGQAQSQATDIQTQLLQKIKEKKALGEDTSRLEGALTDLGGNIQQLGDTTGQLLNQNNLTPKQVVGSAVQTAANFIPGAGKGANLATKVAVGAGTGYAYDVGSKLQNKDKTVGEAIKPGVGTIVGGSIPVASAIISKVVAPVLTRLTKGLASGLSGVGTESIDSIIQNPERAQQLTKELQQKGNQQVLREQSLKIVSGVDKIRKEASTAFGNGLDELSKTDIKPKVFRAGVQPTLEQYGIGLEKGQRTFSNVEFSDPKNIQKASDLVDRLSNAELDGKSLRKLIDDIENSAYKTATSDERISFNRFVQDLAGSIRNAISESTPKLKEINAKYSADIGLSDAVQSIFGNVKFKNAEELNAISQKIEGLANQKGLSPTVVDDFFNRIGGSSKDFRTTEAVRQISNKLGTANPKGVSWSELLQNVTSAVVTPKMVRDIAIFTGKNEPVIRKLLENTAPAARKALLNGLVSQK